MGRPKEFDVDEAVDKAIGAFRRTGYEGTSTQDLCDATGLCRSSIYHTFGSKRELYERALRRYSQRRSGELIEVLRTDRPVRERIAGLFARVIDNETGPVDERGCLTVSAVVELGGRDDDLTAEARESFQRLSGELRCALEAGQCAGEIGTAADPAALADFLQASIGGLRVMARGGAERAQLERIAQVALTTI